MRDFLTETNLIRATGLSAILTLMTMGRLVHSEKPFAIYIGLTFALMAFVCGAVTAWGGRGGMPGIITNSQTLLRGLAVAATVSLVLLPVQLLWLDPSFRNALVNPESVARMELAYPSTANGCLSLVLWSAGFQMMFLQAAPMSFFVRLTGSQSWALGLCVALRALVSYLQIDVAGVTEHAALFTVWAMVTTGVGCLVFARFGLAPTMLLAAGLDLNVFFLPSSAI
jgi:hypothetical protein